MFDGRNLSRLYNAFKYQVSPNTLLSSLCILVARFARVSLGVWVLSNVPLVRYLLLRKVLPTIYKKKIPPTSHGIYPIPKNQNCKTLIVFTTVFPNLIHHGIFSHWKSSGGTPFTGFMYEGKKNPTTNVTSSSSTKALYVWPWPSSLQMSILLTPKLAHVLHLFYTNILQVKFDIRHE